MPFSQGINGAVACDYSQPCRKPAAAGIEGCWIAPQLHEYFLQNVLSGPGISQHPQSHGIHNRRVAVIKLRHGLLVARTYRRHESVIGRNLCSISGGQAGISPFLSTISGPRWIWAILWSAHPSAAKNITVINVAGQVRPR